MKTIKEWFKELPPNVSQKAVANMDKRDLSKRCVLLSSAILIAFYWGDSKEGYYYWEEQYTKYSELEI